MAGMHESSTSSEAAEEPQSAPATVSVEAEETAVSSGSASEAPLTPDVSDGPDVAAESVVSAQEEPLEAVAGEAETPEPEEIDAPEPEGYELPMSPEALALRVEAAVLTSDRALSAAKLGQLLGEIPARYIREAVTTLNAVYESSGRSFRLEVVAGGFKMMTLPAYADVLQPVHRARAQAKLSPAALETLAIIAYRQPIIRAEIEAIRGVASGEVLRSLMERHLVKVVGRADEIGRPMLYGTTKAFLEAFGLASLKDLPFVQSLSQGAR